MSIAMLLAALFLGPLHPPAQAFHWGQQPTHRAAAHRSAHRVERYGVSRPMMLEVERVNVCEEGGNWHVDGPTFFGGLGWLSATWDEFRLPSWPQNMADAPPYMQANAMFRFVWHYGIAMPDQAGCTGSY